MKTKFFLVLILTTFTFNSCQKNEFEQVANNDGNIALSPQTFDNPFTFAGTLHVQFLNDIPNNDANFPDLDLDAIITSTITSIGESGIAPSGVNPADFMAGILEGGLQEELTTLIGNGFDLDFMLGEPDRFFSEELITSKQRDRINTLFNIITTSKSNELFAKRLSTFDNNLNVRQDMSETEKELVFIVSAIVASTGDFIKTVQGDPNNPWHPVLEDKGLCILCLILDAIGAIVGFIIDGIEAAIPGAALSSAGIAITIG